METPIQILQKLSTALHCEEKKVLCQLFAKAIYLLQKTKQRIWNFDLLTSSKKIQPNWNWKLGFRFCWKIFTAIYCQDRNLLCQFFVQAIFLLDKTNRWNLKFWPSRRLEETSPKLFVLNWKPGFRFWWNFPQLFTVRTGNFCINFLHRQFIFQTKTTDENLKFWPSHLFEETLPSFGRLNWKPRFRFS